MRRRLHLRPLQAGEGRVPAEGRAASRSSSTPTTSADAEARKARYAWVSENVNQRARPHQRARRRRDARVHRRPRGARSPRRSGWRSRSWTPPASRPAATRAACAWAQGSAHPPRMVILRHVPRKASTETIALVGKGITFDSGGISLKPGDHMWEMKGDMAGAAAVLFTHARAGPARARREGRRHPVLRGELARRQRAAPGRHLHGQERQVDHGGQHGRRRAGSSSPTACTARARRARRTSWTSRP